MVDLPGFGRDSLDARLQDAINEIAVLRHQPLVAADATNDDDDVAAEKIVGKRPFKKLFTRPAGNAFRQEGELAAANDATPFRSDRMQPGRGGKPHQENADPMTGDEHPEGAVHVDAGITGPIDVRDDRAKNLPERAKIAILRPRRSEGNGWMRKDDAASGLLTKNSPAAGRLARRFTLSVPAGGVNQRLAI